MNLPEKHVPCRWVRSALWFYVLVLLALNVLSWGRYYATGRPGLRRPLFDQSGRFHDLTDYAGKIAHLGSGAAALAHGLPIYNYPAPAAYLYAFFLRGFPAYPVRAYLAVVLAGMAGTVLLLWRFIRKRRPCCTWPLLAAATLTVALGAPLVFALDRGNLEAIVAILAGLGLLLFAASRPYGAAISIGLAAAIKPFPGLFLLLLLPRRLLRPFMLGVAVAAAGVGIALTALGPTPLAAYKDLKPGIADYFSNYVMKVPVAQEGRFDHSLMDTIKLVVDKLSSRGLAGNSAHEPSATDAFLPQNLYRRTPAGPVAVTPTAAQLRHMHTLFVAAMLLSAAGFAYAVRGIFRLPAVNGLILIATAITLFPPLAAEYTMIHLYVPFGLFLVFLVTEATAAEAETEARTVPWQRRRWPFVGMLVLFAILFSPLSFAGPYAGSLKTAALLALLFAAGSFPMPTALFGESAAGPGEGSRTA